MRRDLVEMSAQLKLADHDLDHQQLGYLAAELVQRLGVMLRDQHRRPVPGSARLVLRITTEPEPAVPM